MIKLAFDVHGNHKSQTGNPVGYKRVLSNHWRKDSTDYKEWQEFLLYCVKAQNPTVHALPIPGSPMHMDLYVDVTWANEKHGDLDNVVKGILDTLVENDKEVVRIEANAMHGTVGRLQGKLEIY